MPQSFAGSIYALRTCESSEPLKKPVDTRARALLPQVR
jgi:hypothetical protein